MPAGPYGRGRRSPKPKSPKHKEYPPWLRYRARERKPGAAFPRYRGSEARYGYREAAEPAYSSPADHRMPVGPTMSPSSVTLPRIAPYSENGLSSIGTSFATG